MQSTLVFIIIATTLLSLSSVINGEDASNFIMTIQPAPNRASYATPLKKKSLRGLAKNQDSPKQVIVQFYNGMGASSGITKPDSLKVQFLHDGPTIVFLKQFDWDNDSGGYYLYAENDAHDCTMSLQIHNGNYSGHMTVLSRTYSLVTMIDGSILVEEVDVRSLPAEIDNVVPYNKAEKKGQVETRSLSDQNAHLDSGEVIDILCVYTRQALVGLCDRLGGHKCYKEHKYTQYISRMNDECQLAVDLTDSIFLSSGVEASINLVHSELIDVNYEEHPNMCNMVEYMKLSDSPVFQNIRNLRDQYRADLVGLIVENDNGCGCGSQYDKYSLDNDEEGAYFVVNRWCSRDYYSFAHEIGHSFGCYHKSWTWGHPYANGWIDPDSDFRTVMSYPCTNTDKECGRIPRMSSSDPSLQYNGKITGNESHNNARQINETRQIIANYRWSGQIAPSQSPS